MSGSDPTQDPKEILREAYSQIKQEAQNLRESIVQFVMRRNYLESEVQKLEGVVADLEAKVGLAEELHNDALAAEIRLERDRRTGELERTRAMLNEAIASADAAKTGLPAEEARLAERARELNTQFVERAEGQIQNNAAGSFGVESDALWSRASDKLRNLAREATAREEMAGGAAAASQPAVQKSPDQHADDMLAALEVKLGLAPAPNETAPPQTAAGYLEFDGPTPAAPELAPTAPPPGVAPSPAPPLPEPATPASGPPPISEAQAIAPSPVPAAALPSWIAQTTPAPAPDAPKEAKPETGSRPPSAHSHVRHTSTKEKGESSRMETTQRVRVAAIGTGNIFRGAHLPAYPDIPQVQLVALCDPDKAAQDQAFKRYQTLVEAKIKAAQERADTETEERLERDLDTVQICSDISEVIDTVKPDLVDICTQPFLHAPLSIQALEAGLNVMCEKPMARSWLETQRVIEAVKRTGKLYQHNENWLWDPDYYTAQKLVRSGAIGEPILMFLATAHGGPEGSPKFWNPEFGGGGALLDNGIHAIGAAWYVSGLDKKPTVVKAADPFGMTIRMPQRIIDGRYQQVTVDDDAHILIRYENADSGAWTTAHVEGSWSHRDSPDTVIIGTTGKIAFVSQDGHRYAVVTDAYDRESRRIETSGPTWQHWPSSFYGEILNMVECIRNSARTISGPEFGAECSAIVGASYLSEKNGRRAVHVDEFKAFAKELAGRYPNDLKGADQALVEALLSAVRK